MKNLLTNLNKPCLECGGKVHYEDGGSFTPHIMYNPETGEPVEVASPEEHEAYAEQGFLSEEEVQQMQQQMQQQQMSLGGAASNPGFEPCPEGLIRVGLDCIPPPPISLNVAMGREKGLSFGLTGDGTVSNNKLTPNNVSGNLGYGFPGGGRLSLDGGYNFINKTPNVGINYNKTMPNAGTNLNLGLTFGNKEAGGQSQENGAALMQKNINSHFKKLSKNRNNMFKDDTAPMNQDTDSYGALKLNNFKGYIKQNVEDVMLQEATEAFYKQKANIDMFGVDGAKAIQQEENPQEQAMYGGASNQYYAPGGAYNNGQGNFGMGDSNFDITPWANDYRQTLQENQFNTGALGSMFGSAAENIAGNFYNPQYKTKTKTKLLFGDDKFDPGEAKTDRHGNVKREKSWENSKGETVEGDIKMTKGKIDRDWFGEAYTDDKGVFHDSRRDDKKKFRQWKKGQRNEARRTPNASNQAIFDTRIREQVGEDGNLSNIDMPTLQTDMNELLTNPYNMSNNNWRDQYDLSKYIRQYGGVPEQFGGGVNPYLEMYHEGGNLPSHNHSTSARDMSDMATPSGEQIFLQGWQSGQNNKSAWQNPTWSYGPRNRSQRLSAATVEGSEWTNYGNPAWGGSEPQFGSTWDNQPKIPGVNGYVDAMGVWHGDPTGNPDNFDQYVANRGDWREGAPVVQEDKSKKKTKTASETVEEIQDGTDGGGSDESSLDDYNKGERREWDGEKWVTFSNDGTGRGNYVEEGNNGNRGGNGLYVPPQYGYGQDPRWGNNLYRGNMTNMRRRIGAMPIAYDPSQTRLTEYDYKTKTGLMGRAMGLGPRKEHTRMRFSHAGDAPWREEAATNNQGPVPVEGLDASDSQLMQAQEQFMNQYSTTIPEANNLVASENMGGPGTELDMPTFADPYDPETKEGQRNIKRKEGQDKKADKKVARQEKNKDWTGQSQFDKDGNPLTKDAERALEQELRNNPPPALSPYTTGASYGYGGAPFPEQYPQAAYYPHQYEDGGPHGGPRMSYDRVEPATEPNALWKEGLDSLSFLQRMRFQNMRPAPPTQFFRPTPTPYPTEPTRGEYAMGGEYELTQDEVAQLLAAGGQIEYL